MLALDLTLAVLHHLAFLLLTAALVVEWTLLREPLHALRLRTDAAYGVAALLILVVGGLRVRYGLKCPDYYLHNPWFWAKLGVFAAIGLLSLLPKLRLLRWRRQARLQPGFVPPLAQVAALHRIVSAELTLLALLFVLPRRWHVMQRCNWYYQKYAGNVIRI
ncbi:hypothetical protein HEP74_00041 [Xanthomonas sp. SS]|uniref:DUF2214 family protein n=1 Tax=Xanthomonas sp. SS TaxID=2724122 RepID=UPI00163ACB6D|nr:DUF2214 family protein [Xanthomonas sp. SS]QNH14928.1 hypothetical protein HEP74_00041 [Xanthomonas sp. SS]